MHPASCDGRDNTCPEEYAKRKMSNKESVFLVRYVAKTSWGRGFRVANGAAELENVSNLIPNRRGAARRSNIYAVPKHLNADSLQGGLRTGVGGHTWGK